MKVLPLALVLVTPGEAPWLSGQSSFYLEAGYPVPSRHTPECGVEEGPKSGGFSHPGMAILLDESRARGFAAPVLRDAGAGALSWLSLYNKNVREPVEVGKGV